MNYSIVAFVITLIVLGVYTFVSIRKDGWHRWGVPLGFVFVSLVSVHGFLQTLGGCIPDWMFKGDLQVKSVLFREPVAIYLWGVRGDTMMCVELPWKEEDAILVNGYMDGDSPMVFNQEMGVYPPPQSALPPKDQSEQLHQELQEGIEQLDN